MRGKASQARTDEDRYDYRPLSDNVGKRLDLNDLLKRVADEKNKSKKVNLLIFSGATSVVLVFLLLLSL